MQICLRELLVSKFWNFLISVSYSFASKSFKIKKLKAVRWHE